MSVRSCPANSHGHMLYRWTDSSGEEWACAAYDHGPFCRLCSPVDLNLAAHLFEVEAGTLHVHTEADGTLTFTEAI